MRTALRRIGNSIGFVVPQPLLRQFGGREGMAMDLTIEGGKVVAAPVEEEGTGLDDLLDPSERREIVELALALQAAARTMDAVLTAAEGDLKAANDPERDTQIRQKVLNELDGTDIVLDLDGGSRG